MTSADRQPTTGGQRVLVTGAASPLAGLVMAALEARDDVAGLVGVDVRIPDHALKRTEFVRADLTNPIVARVIETHDVDTVVHLGLAASPRQAGGRARMKEQNVIGVMRLLAACHGREKLRRLVVRSSTAIYGSDHTDPGRFAEDDVPPVPETDGFTKDVAEVEGYVRTFARQHPRTEVTVLRLANLVGGTVDSAFHALFTLPVVPTVLGFDPRLQFCHEHDAVEVLVRAATDAAPGVYNVAGDGVLYLSQCIRLARRVRLPVPSPFVAGVAQALRRSGRVDVTAEQLRFLQFGRAVDTARLRHTFGYEPRYSSRAAFEAFVEDRGSKGPDRGDLERWAQELETFLRRPVAPQPVEDPNQASAASAGTDPLPADFRVHEDGPA